MLVEIRGHDLPGRRFGEHGNVHVGIQRGRTPGGGRPADIVDLVPGDAERARWELVVDVTDGGDLRGPHVQGRLGDRFLYLSWIDVARDGTVSMFRRAKLMLAAVPGDVLAAAARPGWRLVGDLSLCDRAGEPVCAAVRPPVIDWSAAWPV